MGVKEGEKDFGTSDEEVAINATFGIIVVFFFRILFIRLCKV